MNMVNQQIRWGIIGCGDVTEIKSGPAFNKVPHSTLVAVMRRDGAKAADYAHRHGVSKWYEDAQALIDDPEVNAIYIATPPNARIDYALAAIRAGKPIYVEKPLARSPVEANVFVQAAREQQIKMVVAHYRREQPLFKKVKDLLHSGIIGRVQLANLRYFSGIELRRNLKGDALPWRLDPEISGGGWFHDLAPHQLDLAIYFFGEPIKWQGMQTKTQAQNLPADLIAGQIQFQDGLVFSGQWCFTATEMAAEDVFEIVGTRGSIRCSVFGSPQIQLTTEKGLEKIDFSVLPNVQEPMIQATVAYFLGLGPNPCSGEDGLKVMRLLEGISHS